MPKVPVYKFKNFYDVKAEKRKKAQLKVQTKAKEKRLYTKEDMVIVRRLTEINHQLNELKAEKLELNSIIKKRKQLAQQDRLTPVKLYALKLEDDCWYIGMSYNVEKRYKKHSTGKGAGWTSTHPPIEIHEIRTTEYYDQDSASKLEDDMTIEYAMVYGSDKVRGGGYCQRKPYWPDVVVQNEVMYA